MKEFKGTKGDWERGRQNYIQVKNEKPELVENICLISGYGEEAKANAQLIAAAPDLLEALNDIIWLIDKGALSEEIAESIDLKGRKAINKALGQ